LELATTLTPKIAQLQGSSSFTLPVVSLRQRGSFIAHRNSLQLNAKLIKRRLKVRYS
jgi:hypothetical protein